MSVFGNRQTKTLNRNLNKAAVLLLSVLLGGNASNLEGKSLSEQSGLRALQGPQVGHPERIINRSNGHTHFVNDSGEIVVDHSEHVVESHMDQPSGSAVSYDEEMNSGSEMLSESEEPVGLLGKYFTDREQATVEEEIPWKGYLQEKGPSRVMVKQEREQELEELSDEIWSLIMGSKTITDKFEDPVDLRRRALDTEETTVQVKKTPIETRKTTIEPEVKEEMPEPTKLEDAPTEIEDESENYQQLLT